MKNSFFYHTKIISKYSDIFYVILIEQIISKNSYRITIRGGRFYVYVQIYILYLHCFKDNLNFVFNATFVLTPSLLQINFRSIISKQCIQKIGLVRKKKRCTNKQFHLWVWKYFNTLRTYKGKSKSAQISEYSLGYK